MILVDTSVWIDHFRRGVGLVDLHLFASTFLTPGTRLWTLDRRLLRLTQKLNIAYQPHDE